MLPAFCYGPRRASLISLAAEIYSRMLSDNSPLISFLTDCRCHAMARAIRMERNHCGRGRHQRDQRRLRSKLPLLGTVCSFSMFSKGVLVTCAVSSSRKRFCDARRLGGRPVTSLYEGFTERLLKTRQTVSCSCVTVGMVPFLADCPASSEVITYS